MVRGATGPGSGHDAARARLDALWRRGREFLGTDLAVLGGAMSWLSERHLVAAISEAGGFGVLAGGSMPPDLLAAEIDATRALTDKPFGVNLITMHPALDGLIDVCRDRQVSHVVLAGGRPTAAAMRRVKEFARLVCFAPTLGMAKLLIRNGADALVIEGNEAGGHVGPVSLAILAQEILPAISAVPVFCAGGIGRGTAVAALLEMGAAGVQMGTAFVCAHECIAHPDFKQAFIRAKARDAVTSAQIDARFPVIPVRALANKGTEAFMETQRRVIGRFHDGEIDEAAAQLEIEHFWAGALRRAVIDGDVEFGSVMAGQSVGLVKKEQPVAEILAEVVAEAVAALARREAAAR